MSADKEDIENLLREISKAKSAESGSPDTQSVFREKRAKLGEEAFLETVRRIVLYATDALWMEHLEAMDYLRSSVNLRAYGQREPIVEYKKDGLAMFKEMEEAFKEQVFSLIGTITEPAKADDAPTKQTLVTSHAELSEDTKSAQTDVASGIGRNDPCPCGAINPATGEVYKYKKCGLINAPQHRKSLIN